MKDFDQKKLDAMLDAGQFVEADAYIKSIFAEPVTPASDAKAIIDYYLIYMKMMNIINRRYLDSMRETVGLLQKTKSARGAIDDSFKVAKIKADLFLKA